MDQYHETQEHQLDTLSSNALIEENNYNLLHKIGSKELFILGPVQKEADKKDGDTPDLINNEKEYAEKSEEWKANEWKKWIAELDKNSETFASFLKQKKEEWILQRELEWKEWIKFMEEKWDHYRENVNQELDPLIFNDASTWTDEQWKNWMKTKGKQLIENDWKNWVSKINSYRGAVMDAEWIQKKNDKIMEWVKKEWKCKEDNYWDSWENNTWSKWFSLKERKKWTQWKDRLNKEAEEWIAWVADKENQYLGDAEEKLEEWKKNHYILFNKWMQSYINKWIAEKKWNHYSKQPKILEHTYNYSRNHVVGIKLDEFTRGRKMYILVYGRSCMSYVVLNMM
ncbi:variable surface protein [Plasmodium gonderi]|uniref:Variable surface protein n=1 Tax=Plasmodium gonderi TaxID=77519 RepID=A0A1Y1JS05_PLAGO|nr:variable surface protein [Plasmodium gonderi]GAW83977.1 variable surface protein [Plasmodium gonderi]